MLNIFNLFLVLFSLWVLLMFSFAKVTWLYVFLGIVISGAIAGLSFKKELINKDSDFAYLAVGFYLYFAKVYAKNIIAAYGLLLQTALMPEKLNPLYRTFDLEEESEVNIAILIASINFHAGLTAYFSDAKLHLHCADGRYYERFYLEKTLKEIRNINENNAI